MSTIAITGSTGLVGTYLSRYFHSHGHKVLRVVRPQTGKSLLSDTIEWDIPNGTIEAEKLEGVDVVLHLAGAGIADRRWSDSYKTAIRESRVEGTRLIAGTLSSLKQPPKLLISSSAVGYYGNHAPEVVVDESTPPAADFLAEVCIKWEEETQIAAESGIRVVNLRTGVVLDGSGGALAKMLPIFKLGAGGPIGDGRQMMSWIALAEFPGMLEHIMNHSEISGPVNATSPNAVSNAEFTKTLGRALHRPAFLPVPPPALRLLFGEMADALLINGVHVKPRVLLETGYMFRYPRLEQALEDCLR
jgi:uncharacterized protein (TIGR01777 family)